MSDNTKLYIPLNVQLEDASFEAETIQALFAAVHIPVFNTLEELNAPHEAGNMLDTPCVAYTEVTLQVKPRVVQ